MHRKWNKDAIALEILSMYESGETLNYSSVAGNNLSLLRAATRYFGTWGSSSASGRRTGWAWSASAAWGIWPCNS